MRNQQIKKVNRIFFSGQDEEKRKWIEQMADEGWQLVSGTSFVYSFQKIASENDEYQSSYKSILGLDLQKSMPLFQDSGLSQLPLLNDQNYQWKTPLLSSMPKSATTKPAVTANNRRRWLGTTAIFLFLFMSFVKFALFSTGDFVSLFEWQFFSSLLLAVFCLVFGGMMLLKGFLKILALECKSKD
jgi:hypothetical protein